MEQTPLLLEVNTHRAKLRDVVEKIVTSKLGMNLPLITHGSGLLYEVGDDLDQDMVTNYAANLEKVCTLLSDFMFLSLQSVEVTKMDGLDGLGNGL